ncbi:uncharacterized protein LOC122368726 [Amphibalanus amphitrite]|uniref:uncharacterized protein LOC122368726 n=1 Tax=Amphibalanus amphitrite TaxID=1232801 RepID=UPI001C90C20D|nr:uncharacterized protein LOC122368726 [Amphibalanus amphitrite]
MKSALQILLAALAVSLVTSGSYYGRRSSGRSQSAITFTDSRRPPGPPVGSSVQFGETHATSVQNSAGDGQQTNRGEAGAVSVQKQTGLGGATQSTVNQGTIESLQRAEGGGGGGRQSSDNQVTINSSQLQQNVDGTLVNVQAGHEGVVIINTNDETGGIGEFNFKQWAAGDIVVY